MIRWALFATLAGGGAGCCHTCRVADGRLELVTADAGYRPGSVVSLVLENATSDLVTLEGCVVSLERRRGDAWEPVPDRGAPWCPRGALDPCGRSELKYEVGLGTAPGEYRLRVGAQWPPGTDLFVVSNAFHVL